MTSEMAKKQEYQHQKVVIVRISESERSRGEISDDNLGMAVAAMHRDGIVVLENAVDVSHVDKLQSILAADAEMMAKLPTTHFNDVSIQSCAKGFLLTITDFR